MVPNTHLEIDRRLSGEPLELIPGKATVQLKTTVAMAADDRGLIHGGFIFSLADYAAMLAVNHPNVVLGAAEVTFLRPVRTKAILTAHAEATERLTGRKHLVTVAVLSEEAETVFSGVFTCYVLETHVLDMT